MLNDKDKALFEKNSFTGWYHGNHCLMDAVQFEQAIKERDEQRTCKNCVLAGEFNRDINITESPRHYCQTNEREYTCDDTCKMFQFKEGV